MGQISRCLGVLTAGAAEGVPAVMLETIPVEIAALDNLHQPTTLCRRPPATGNYLPDSSRLEANRVSDLNVLDAAIQNSGTDRGYADRQQFCYLLDCE